MNIRLMILKSVFLLFLFFIACGETVVEQRTVSAPPPKLDEPGFQIASFNIMSVAQMFDKLPYLSVDGGKISPVKCFEKEDDVKLWETQNPEVFKYIQANGLAVEEAIKTWLKTELLNDVNADLTNVKIDIDNPAIRNIDEGSIRFDNNFECLSADIKMLPADSKVVTTLFGAKKLILKSASPFEPLLLKKMKKSGAKKNIQVISVMTYKPAVDENGKKVFKKGKPLFEAPDGSLVLKKDVPSPAKRPVFEVIIKIPMVLNFAYGDMLPSNISYELNSNICEIGLIFDDLTPRAPECLELNDAAFGIQEGDDSSKLVVKMADAESTSGTQVEYGKPAMITTGGRVVAWVTAGRAEEGARLLIDSLVLQPSLKKVELFPKFRFGNEPLSTDKKRKKVQF
ncbi:MAG: hypothetical protein JXR91_12430 [Deltaproteobacteria bacterium]|nr:hypothetical protein [Deltaproteobacteria bacterium]